MRIDDDDTVREPVGELAVEPGLAATDTFLRALLQHQQATDALGAAILAGDAAVVEATAFEAFSFLLTARAVLRRLESNQHSDPARIRTARYGVRTNQRALLDLFDRARTQLHAPELHGMLDQLRASLILAK